MEDVRLQKVIADSGLCSRRKAEELIEAGRVKVNGHPAFIGQKINPKKDLVTVDGQKLQGRTMRQYQYIMLNKPRGYLTAMSDDRGRKCVVELLKNVLDRVYPVGRLDLNSEGLLLFTNDGEFANLMMHPSHRVPKCYRVTVHNEVTDETQIALSEGVEIDGVKTLPAEVRVVTEEEGRTVMLITITEGRNRQIRKMCEAVGLTVARLKRISIGPLRLGMLKPGEYRSLKKDEVDALIDAAKKSMGKSVRPGVYNVAPAKPAKKPAPQNQPLGKARSEKNVRIGGIKVDRSGRVILGSGRKGKK